jgi:hypothetical protein
LVEVDEVTESNDNDGVAVTIERLLRKGAGVDPSSGQ